MFLLKSAFWLTIGFILVAPHGVDLGAAANLASAKAIDAGQKFIVSQIVANECRTLDCAGAKAVVAIANPTTPSFDATMQDSSKSPVPFPRPRPDWMG